MKKFFYGLIFMLIIFRVHSESPEDASAREIHFLKAQKASLLKLKSDLGISKNQRINKSKIAIGALESELTKTQVLNQELLEEHKSIEKMTKDGNMLGSQVEKNLLKMNEVASEVSAKIGFVYTEPKGSDSVNRFEKGLEQLLEIITTLSNSQWREHAFVDEHDKLVRGEVLFVGLHSAWGKYNNKIMPLTPYNEDFLKVVARASSGEIFIFNSDFQKVSMLSAKTWKESIADKIPGLVMVIIMLAVLGLFVMLARS